MIDLLAAHLAVTTVLLVLVVLVVAVQGGLARVRGRVRPAVDQPAAAPLASAARERATAEAA